jgi:hypothetical protein
LIACLFVFPQASVVHDFDPFSVDVMSITHSLFFRRRHHTTQTLSKGTQKNTPPNQTISFSFSFSPLSDVIRASLDSGTGGGLVG